MIGTNRRWKEKERGRAGGGEEEGGQSRRKGKRKAAKEKHRKTDGVRVYRAKRNASRETGGDRDSTHVHTRTHTPLANSHLD